MKKIITLIASVVLAASTSAFAQNMDFGGFFGGDMPNFDMGMFGEMSEGEYDELADVTSAKDYATEKADMLSENIGLSEEQYNKVYKIYKTEAQTYINSNAMGSSDPMMMMGGSMGKSSSKNDKEKRLDKRNKKMADVLTSEQFNMYLRLEATK